MICIHLKNQDPYFCLAAEEYLLKNFKEDIFLLWQSENTVVVGKHQNALGEINYPFVRKNNITVARRISGGGTVFHDQGNVNFSFIKNVNSPAEVNFKIFTQPIIDALAKLGVEAGSSGRNDLLIDGKKISGNAEHVYKNRVLHHGTLLFISDLKNLGQAIKVIPGKYIGKAIQSNRSEVCNISPFLKFAMNTDQFLKFLLEHQLENEENSVYELTKEDEQQIEKLVDDKFSTWEWNYGYSPKYTFKNTMEIGGKKLDVELSVKKGMIESCQIKGDYFSSRDNKALENQLHNKRHSFEELSKLVLEYSSEKNTELANALF